MTDNESLSLREPWTSRQILQWTTQKFKDLSLETPQLDAQLLLCHVLQVSKIQLYMDLDRPLSHTERNNLRELVKKRMNGAPVAYLLQEKHWYQSIFYVDSRVLIPRPETECIIDFALDAFPNKDNHPRVIFDFCTGSGCLAITLATLFPNAQVVAIDISPLALAVAKENCQRLNTPHISLKELDLTNHTSYLSLLHEFGQAQLIVANPPYISEHEWPQLATSVKDFEPKIALTAPQNGLGIAFNIIEFCEKYELLRANDSFFAMELGINQPQKILNSALLNNIRQIQTCKTYEVKCDLDGNPRFLCSQDKKSDVKS